MKQLLLCVGYCLLTLPLFAQTGSPTDPFTSLSQARSVTVAGNYSFAINGVAFRTYVDTAGYVQVAYDDRTDPTPKTKLSQFTDLPQGTRGILSAQVMATLGNLTELRISSSDLGQLDARTFTDSTLTSRIISFRSLLSGSAGNAHMEGWTGTGSQWLRADAGDTRAVQPLDEEIVHVYNNRGSGGVHWYPSRGDRNLFYKQAIPEPEPWTLWVRGAAQASAPGSRDNPFTSLGQSLTVTTPGVYYFNLGGPVFDTYVDGKGYVQVAIDFGGTNTALPQSDHLQDTARGILTPAALASLTDIGEVRMTSSVPNTLDAVTADPGVIAKVQANDAIMTDSRDNAINQSWTGTGSEFLLGTSNQERPVGNDFDRPLQEEIYHSYHGTGMHWIPHRGDQGLRYQQDVAPADKFVLWVRSARFCAIDIGSLTPTDVGCPGAADGAINAVASCGSCADGLEYSLDNTTFQSGGQFSDLASGIYTVYVRAAGGTTGCLNSGTVTVAEGVDDTPPVIDALPDRSITLDCGDTYTVPPPVALDVCSGSVTGTTTDATLINRQGVYTIDWTFTDAAGNTRTRTETVGVANAVIDVPFTETLEPNSPLLNCWSVSDNNASGTSWAVTEVGSELAHGGSRAWVLAADDGGLGQDDVLTSPKFNAFGGMTYALDFAYRPLGQNVVEELNVSLLDVSTGSVVRRLFADREDGNVYREISLHFDVPATGAYQLVFASRVGAGSQGLLLDDISVYPYSGPVGGAADLVGDADDACTTLESYGLSGNAFARFLNPAGRLALEIDPNGNNLGDVTVELRDYAAPPLAPFDGRYYLSRHVNIEAENGPGPYTVNGGVRVRLYYTEEELQEFRTTTGQSSGWNDLVVTHYSDLNEDCDITNSTGTDFRIETVESVTPYGSAVYALTFTTTGFSEFGATTADGAFPVTLRSFRGDTQGKLNRLDWEVDVEVSFSHYAVERSLDGRTFTEVGRVAGTQQPRYTFTEAAPAAAAYYRLRMVDLDGAYAHSRVVRIADPETEPALAVYPVPTRDELTVGLTLPRAQVVRLVLIDVLGRPVLVTTRQAGEGDNRFTLDLGKLPVGTYVLRVQGAASSGIGGLDVSLVQTVRVVRR